MIQTSTSRPCLFLCSLASLLFWGNSVQPRSVQAAPPANPAATPQIGSAPKFALLVGINKYDEEKGLISLDGCINDVQDIKSSLIANFGFRAQNIVTLTNEQATRRGVVNAIRAQLLANTKKYPNATLLFFYSGHGSTAQDTSGDEKRADPNDIDDETLVTFDSTREPDDREHFDLIDDDIDTLFTEIRGVKNFTGTLTSIIDACHSGTVTRGKGDPLRRVREVKPDTRPYPKTGLVTDKVNPTSVKSPRFAAFSGCMPTETSQEDAFPTLVNGKSQMRAHGALSYYLLQAMKNATKTTSNGEIWSQVARNLSAHYDQNPQLEGNSQLSFLGGATRASAPPIQYTLSGKTMKIACGVESGALKGGFVTVTAPRSKDAGSNPQLLISSAKLGTSEVVVPDGVKVPASGSVKLLTPYFGSKAVKVKLGEGVSADNPVAKRLAAYFVGSKANYAALASTGEKADLALVASSRGDALLPSEQPLSETDRAQKGYYLSLGPGVKPLFGVFLPANEVGDISSHNEERLRQTLENYAVQRNLLLLSNDSTGGMGSTSPASKGAPAPAPGQALQMTVYRVKGTKQSPIDITTRTQVKVNERLKFKFTNQSSKPLYVAMLWLFQDGSIQAIPDQDTRKVMVLKPKGEPGATAWTTEYEIVPPTGEENLKVFASTQPLDVFYLERDAVKKDPRPPSPIESIVGQATGKRAPASDGKTFNFDSWTTCTIGLSIAD